MNNLLYRNPIKGACLGAMLLLGLTACTDDHFDITPATSTSGSTLWQNIASRPELSSFQEILSRTKVIRKVDDQNINTQHYSDLLNSAQTFTLWAPLNGTYGQFSPEYYLARLDEADALQGNGKYVESNKIHEEVGTQFIQNHLARFNFETEPGEQQVRLLNSKVCYYDMGKGLFNGVKINSDYGRIVSSNGMMFMLDGRSPFSYNIYEYIETNPDGNLEKVNEILIQDPEVNKKEFNEYASTPGATDENGHIIYVDSVWTKTNTILDYTGASVSNEDSLYIAVIPSDAAWDKAYEAVSALYTYNKTYKYDWNTTNNTMGKTSETLNIDSLQEFNTKAALIRSMFFTPGHFDEEISRSDSAALIDYVLYHDSLRSTNGVYYYNPKTGNNGSNPLFNNQKPLKASNGYIFPVTDYTLPTSYSFQKKNEIDFRYTYNVLNVKGGTSNKILLTDANKNPLIESTVPDNTYTFFRKDPSNNMEVYIRLDNIMAGKYKISVQLLPNRICEDYNWTEEGEEGEEISLPQHTPFRAQLKYDDGKNVTKKAQTDVMYVDDDGLQTYVLYEAAEFTRSYAGLPSGINSFPYLVLRLVTNDIEKENRTKVNGLSVVRVLVEPVRE